ncbi:amidase [Microbacterium sp. cx-55]|uniref:amidase n=1 Tax=Microbacterium sp. cx-55 TaxID=2875948 RepID=UPI001CBD6288|nr:amidase [Microbacterium sp. cx-55]MBZ4488512.1 amidase [Microbacterium sp. cx-55]UGB36097.1 amidase [Microbacterium sp. cx-55]
MTALHDLPAIELSRMLRDREVDPVALTAHYLQRIAAIDDRVGAFVEVTADRALAQAAQADAAVAGPLRGMPLADKDLVARAGVPTRYGSRARRDFVPERSDELAAALDTAGAVNLGKTATPEFGLTGYTETSFTPPTRDPWNTAHGAGGSSGGAAAAVAASLLPLAVGSDGGGSIRIPAATVGIVGLKPSRGRMPIGSGIDSLAGLAVTGPLARTVADAAFLADALHTLRPHPFALTAPDPGPLLPAALAPRDGLRVGVTTVSPWDDDEQIELDPAARAAVEHAAAVLSAAGTGVDEFRWAPVGYAEMFRTIWRASAARLPLSEADLALVEPITAWLVQEGRALPATRLLDALASAAAFERQTIAAFAPFDAVLTPALAQSPRPIGWYDRENAERNFAQQVQYAPYSSFVNVAGLPAITVPVTTDGDGHPVSVQLVGRPGGEAAIVSLAAVLEAHRGALPHPPLW